MKTNRIIQGGALAELKKMADDSIDCIVTDPPYGYSFMGKDWDKAVPKVEVWQECLRVLKPGAFAFVMSAPRSDVQMHMIDNLTRAGFRMDFTPIYWTYASGFPKAGNIGKMVDKRKSQLDNPYGFGNSKDYENGNNITAPSTDQAKALDGSYAGFQPKPAVEVVLVAMKPLSEKTFVDQAMKNGKGVTWLDRVRIPTESTSDLNRKSRANKVPKTRDSQVPAVTEQQIDGSKGRFPANLLVSDDSGGSYSRFFDLDSWWSERIKELPESVRKTFPFLICPKASKSEKNKGTEHMEPGGTGVYDDDSYVWEKNGDGSTRNKKVEKRTNHHPTVKPLKLMSYLITLGSRPGDIVLDPFAGSGTTCIAAEAIARKWIGIELEKEYVDIANARLSQRGLGI